MMGKHGGNDDDDDDDDGDLMSNMSDMGHLMIAKIKYFALVPVFFGVLATLAGAKGIVAFIFGLYTIIAVVYSFKLASGKSEINNVNKTPPQPVPVPVPVQAAAIPSIPYEFRPPSVPYEYLYPSGPMQMPFNQWRR